MARGAKGPRRARALLAAVGTVTVVAAGSCRVSTPVDRSYADQANEALARGQVPWFCHSEGLGDEMDHADRGGLANVAYEGRTKGDLSPGDCRTVATMFDQALVAAAKWPTRAAAKRDGWYLAVPDIPGLGTHEAHPDLSKPAVDLDPARPYWLQYESEQDDARLAGLSWVVTGEDRAVPPDGFPGDNDWLHTHWSTCEGAVGLPGGGNEVPDEVCEAHGGTNIHTPGTWVIHAWIVKGYENRYDVFAGSSACLLGETTPTASDPCHDKAVGTGGHQHDPQAPTHTHGTAPSTGSDPAGGPQPPATSTTTVPAHGSDHDHGSVHDGGHGAGGPEMGGGHDETGSHDH